MYVAYQDDLLLVTIVYRCTTLSEETTNPSVYYHLSQLFVDMQLGGLIKQVKSCGSVSCLINTEPLELLHLQPDESIASESVVHVL